MSNCNICKKKLNKMMLSIYTCKCNKVYCDTHINSHNCTYDYKRAFECKIKHTLPSIKFQKVEEI